MFAVRAGEDPAAPAMLGELRGERWCDHLHAALCALARRDAARDVITSNRRPKVEATFGEAAKAIAATTTRGADFIRLRMSGRRTRSRCTSNSRRRCRAARPTHIRVRRCDQGRAIVDPFVEIEQELWDASGKRLTVLFDPGQVKRGLRRHNKSGPAADGRADGDHRGRSSPGAMRTARRWWKIFAGASKSPRPSGKWFT